MKGSASFSARSSASARPYARARCALGYACVGAEQAEQLMLWVQHIRGHPTPQVAQDHLFWIDARLPFPLRVWNLPFASRRRLPAQRAQG